MVSLEWKFWFAYRVNKLITKNRRGPMGGALYTGPKLGDRQIFKVSVSYLDANLSLGKLPVLST